MSLSNHSDAGIENTQRLQEVSIFEGSRRVINEWYSKDEYIRRRLGFLDKHSVFHKRTKLLPIVTSNADEVFSSNTDTLSAQQVRQCELGCDIDPLLPFPTSENTETLDDFGIYPPSEWEPGTEINMNPNYPSSPYRQASATPRPRTADAMDPFANVSDQAELFSSLAQGTTAHEAAAAQVRQTANAASNLTPEEHFRARTLQYAHMMAPRVLNPPSREDLNRVLQALDRPPSSLYEPIPTYNSEDGVSSVPKRAIKVPIKSPHGTKRPIDDGEDNHAASNSASYTISPPRGNSQRSTKRLKLNAPTSSPPPDSTYPAESEPESLDSPPKARKKSTSRANQTAKRRATGTTTKPKSSSSSSKGKQRASSPAPTRKTPLPPPGPSTTSTATNNNNTAQVNDRLQRVANGTILPRTRAEAHEAQTLRHQTLLLQQQPQPKKSRRHPDLSPEFFSAHNFTARELADGPVRCPCGARTDDRVSGEAWIRCDGEACAGSWQHVRCLGDAVAADAETRERESYAYLCHACDAWRHRRVLQKLRRGEAVR